MKLLTVCLLSLSLVACGDDTTAAGNAASGGGAGVGGAGSAGVGGAAGAVGGYPAGPYGFEVGEVFPDSALTGHVNPAGGVVASTLPITDYSFDALRTSGAPYALVHTSASFCGGCRSAAEQLTALAPPVQAAGAQVVEVLIFGDVTAWAETYGLPTTVVAPVAGSTLGTDAGGREWAYVLDLATMRIVWKGFGSYGPTDNSSAKQGLAELTALLGP